MKAPMMLPASALASILQNMVIGKNRAAGEKVGFLIDFETEVNIMEDQHKKVEKPVF
jgi:hypothetical protein